MTVADIIILALGLFLAAAAAAQIIYHLRGYE
jgi:hypothetical protein